MAQPVDHLVHLDVTMVAFDSIVPSLMGRLTSFQEPQAMEPSL